MPFLVDAKYSLQMNFLLQSGWSSGQNVVPYLNPSKYQSYYVIPSFLSLQKKWAFENGLDTAEFNSDQILFYQLETLKPDVIYLSDIPCFNFKILDFLTKKPMVIAWHATSLPETINWSAIDLLLSGVGSIRSKAMELGVKASEEFMSGAPNFQQNIKSNFLKYGDVCFSGSFINNLHNERAQLFNEAAHNVEGYQFDIYSSNIFNENPSKNLNFLPPVFARDVIDVYSNYKITLDARANFGLNDLSYSSETSNMRIFEATKSGSLLLTQASRNLNKYFEIDKEIVTYESKEDLFDKLEFYLCPARDSLRQSIAEKGYLKTINNHSIEKRAIWFNHILDKYIR
jgi:hypothetical protein